MDSQLSSRLAALTDYSKPVSSLHLLRILAPFLYNLSHPAADGNDSDRVQTIHYLMETWYVRQAKTDSISDGGWDFSSGVCCCYSCGSVLGNNWAGLTLSCGKCKRPPKLTYYFLADLLDHCYQIPHPATVFIISEYLGARHARNSRNRN